MRKAGRTSVNDVSAETPIDPLLLYVALSLLTVLGILEADIHRKTLEAVGIVINTELGDSRFLGP